MSFVKAERQGWLEISDVITVCIFFFSSPLRRSSHIFPLSMFLDTCWKSWFRQRSLCYRWGLDFRRMSPLHWDVHSSARKQGFTVGHRHDGLVFCSVSIFIFPLEKIWQWKNKTKSSFFKGKGKKKTRESGQANTPQIPFDSPFSFWVTTKRQEGFVRHVVCFTCGLQKSDYYNKLFFQYLGSTHAVKYHIHAVEIISF